MRLSPTHNQFSNGALSLERTLDKTTVFLRENFPPSPETSAAVTFRNLRVLQEKVGKGRGGRRE